MSDVSKRPQVIRDLIELATYIAEDNLEASDRFLAAAETTFKQLGKMPGMGKPCQFSHPNLAGVRQQAIKGFKNYLVFYLPSDSGVEILRVIYGGRDIETILDEDLGENDLK
ncbi:MULTISPECIES: type II toxin-antitoxin system RelE/ParE family toxin [Nostoc]|uniref:Type II toxin-antitoxin system RelE/ParE family toxin n=2 Tax=Nostoc TaxID=1177 RepID=A0ABR8IBQ8_9NOSO|nr:MULTISPECIES: type II toxin-antitoxin system RelE/ParE family toxin [Nostoc]MBD2563351.1 type II toxin-antitoxin system RelE/ParE family toxin [Nostoc linckia FACHB-391]MBD2649059.1 type II toxin-antitoxin system RelE/ParE family toxin [Nostoc foliaceum FACHB-393]